MYVIVWFGERAIRLVVNPDDLVMDMKTTLLSITQIPQDEQLLLFNGTELMNGRTASSYRIQNDDIVDLLVRPVHVPCAICQPPPINIDYDVANGVTYNRRMNHGVIRFSNGLYG